jgi:hypothetical protein
MTSVDHALLTRFNLPTPGVESLIRAREGWLIDRVSLFERYTIPSVAAQTSTSFRWLVYFDPQSPGWLMRRIEEWAQQPCFVPVFRSTVSTEDLLCDIEAHTGRQHPVLLTSNVDNDDALAVDFIERVQGAQVRADRSAVYLVEGLIRSDTRLYRRADRRNAFCSTHENRDVAQTCWSEWHTMLGNVMPVVELTGAPGWLQVVHGANVSNRVRGRLVAPARYRSAFPDLLSDLPSPSRPTVLHDRAVLAPARAGKELARALAKRAALQVLGQEGLSDAKERLARASGRGVADATSPGAEVAEPSTTRPPPG